MELDKWMVKCKEKHKSSKLTETQVEYVGDLKSIKHIKKLQYIKCKALLQNDTNRLIQEISVYSTHG